MAYNKTEWIANQTLVSANNLNKMEQGIAEAHNKLEEMTNTDVDQKVQEALEEAKEYADEKAASIVGASHETLDTLKEIGDALGNDANFAATVTRQIGEKLGKTENAASASKLKTARKIKLDGAITGEGTFDGSEDITLKTQRRSCICGNANSATQVGNYYKVASTRCSNGTNHQITFKVTCSNSTANGILALNIRRESNSVPFGKKDIIWETITGEINVEDFILAYYEQDTSSCFELWLQSPKTWCTYRFEVLDEGQLSQKIVSWTLYNSLSGVGSITEGSEIKTSTVASLKNSAEKLTTPRKISLTGAVMGTGEFDGSKDTTISVLRKGCVVGLNGSSNSGYGEKKYFRVAQGVMNSNTSTTFHVTFKVTDTYNNASGILRLVCRKSLQIIEFETITGLDPSRYLLAYKTGDDESIFELWIKEDRSFVSMRFEVLDEGGLGVDRKPMWTLYSTSGVNNATESLPEGYQAKTANIATLKNNISGKAPETLKDAKAYVDERLATLTQLLVTRGILEKELVTIPELEEDIETEE